MEVNGEQIIKKEKRTPKWIIFGYIICIIVAISALFSMKYRKENTVPEPIDFAKNEIMGLETNKYVYLEVEGLTHEIAIYGDAKNQSNSKNDRYYVALYEGNWYVVDLDFETIDTLKPLQDYLYSEGDVAVPEPVTIYGMTEEIPTELKGCILEFFNEGVVEESKISLEEFEKYFGTVLLNVRKEPVDTLPEKIIIIVAAIVLVIIAIVHIATVIIKSRKSKNKSEN